MIPIPILIAALADKETRARGLERLIDAIQKVGVNDLALIPELFGAIEVFQSLANQYADETVELVRSALTA